MKTTFRIKAIKGRAAVLGLTLRGLCLRAYEDLPGGTSPKPVAYGLINKWERGVNGPTERKAGPCLRGLDKALADCERETFFALAPRFMEPGDVQRLVDRHGFDLASLSQSPAEESDVPAGTDAVPASSAPVAAASGEGV